MKISEELGDAILQSVAGILQRSHHDGMATERIHDMAINITDEVIVLLGGTDNPGQKELSGAGSDGQTAHYGSADDPYEAIKVIEAWGLGFHLGNAVKYISRAGKKSGETLLKDLKKAAWYLDRFIKLLERGRI